MSVTAGPSWRPATIGWAFVAVQVVLLATLVLLPHRDDWATPGWLDVAGLALVAAGIAVGAAAALRLGTALTPTPVPTAEGRLTTDGLYRFARHPIYTGVLAVVVGLTVRSGSWITLAVAVATVGFFDRKARWEEARLAERYPDYPDYAESVPRFVPRPWRWKT